MLCSTIIPTVNQPSLERAVRSVLTQNLGAREQEIIIVNDSGEPLPEREWLLAPNVRVINTNRVERSAACNLGAASASGKYLKILHDDDYLLPGALQTLVNLAEKSKASWVYGAVNRVDNDGGLISIDRPRVRGNILASLIGGECLHLAPSLMHRDAFIKVGGFDPEMSVREDYDLECRLALSHDFAGTDELVAVVRIGRIGGTTDWSKVSVNHRIVREKILDSPAFLPRLLDSIGRDVTLRGRCCRAVLISAILNLRSGRILRALNRLSVLIRLTGVHLTRPEFWRGLRFKTHWHQVEKLKEELHFQIQSEKQFTNL